MFKKMLALGTVIAVVSIGAMAFAQDGSTDKTKKGFLNNGRKGNIEAGQKVRGQMNDDILTVVSKKLNISAEDFKKAVDEERETALINRAKELGISTDGKTSQQLRQEIAEKQKEAEMANVAKRLNISVEELTKAIEEEKEDKLIACAKNLGIETDGKTIEEIKKELDSKRPEGKFHRGNRKGMPFDGQNRGQRQFNSNN